MTDWGLAANADRAKRLLSSPRAQWPRLAAEPMTLRDIWLHWAAPMAAIGPVSVLIAAEAWGFRALDTVYRPPLVNAVATALVSWLVSLAGVWALALVIDGSAPSFGARRDHVAATKVAVFSATAGWLAQLFWLIPAVGALSLVGFYSLYLLWLGLPVLMKPPPEKATTYVAVTVACGVIALLLLSLVSGWVGDALTPPTTSPGAVMAR